MKYFLLILMALSIISCKGASDSSSSDDSSNKPPIDVTPPDTDFSWGELECQKRGDCSNPVLNISQDDLEWFLESQFSIQEIQASSEFEQYFLCGVDFQEKWINEFAFNDTQTDEDFNLTTEFAHKVLDLKKCLVRADYKTQMNQYFKNTKEYQNENQ